MRKNFNDFLSELGKLFDVSYSFSTAVVAFLIVVVAILAIVAWQYGL